MTLLWAVGAGLAGLAAFLVMHVLTSLALGDTRWLYLRVIGGVAGGLLGMGVALIICLMI